MTFKLASLAITVCALHVGILAAFCGAQTNPAKPKDDLAKMPAERLRACFDDLKICGAENIWTITEEFERRLPQLPTEMLANCFGDWRICGVGDDQASGFAISDEIAKRGNPSRLQRRYWREPDPLVRNGIEHVAYHFRTPEISAFMKRIVLEKVDDGEDRYWPINYLAKECDPVALRELSTGRFRNQGSLQYQSSVELFGKCQYHPAIPYLVDEAVFDFSLNIVDAAVDSLEKLYPQSPKEFRSIEAMQKYYCGRAKQDDLAVTCKSK